MKKIILLELLLLFLGTTFKGDSTSGWFEQTIPRRDLYVLDLKFIDSLKGFMISTSGVVDTAFIFKTLNGGNNWSSSFYLGAWLRCMDFVNDSVGYCGGAQIGSGLVMKTTNGGNNWYIISNVASWIIIEDIDFVNSDTGWVCSTSITDGGLWRTIDGGMSWQKQLNTDYDPSKIFFINSNTGWIIGNSKTNIYKTTNCGGNWLFQIHFSNSISNLFFSSPDTGWLIGGGGNGILRTTNGGNNWHSVNNPPIYAESQLFFLNNNKGWSGGYKIVFATLDGYNWGFQNTPGYAHYNVSFVDSMKGWAGYAGLVHTTDGGGLIVNSNEFISEIPIEYELGQNYPNPFNQSSVINYKCSTGGIITIKVFDVRGKEIATLVNERKQPGSYRVVFEAKDIPSGIYFYQLSVDNIRYSVKKMAVIK